MSDTLTVTITESVTLNGTARGSTNSLSISAVDDIYHRIVTCPANNETRLVDFHSSVADAGAADTGVTGMDVQNVNYIRVTNLDNTNDVTLGLCIDQGEDDTAADVTTSILLKAKESFIMGRAHDSINTGTNANFVTDLVDLEGLEVQPGSNAVQVEVFVASVV
tara:strand:- start:106 stop:597 length:492 start_codon:yes stop_codon:yes gene_type:complete